MIYLKKITQENIFKVIELSQTLDDYQKTCVAPNAISIAQAYVSPEAWPRAIYHDDELIGFVMLSLDPKDVIEDDLPAYYIWRLMIAKPYQYLGYGKEVLDLIIKKAKEDHQSYLYTSCEMKEPMPYQFYSRYGFIDTNQKDGEEEVLKLKL